MLSTQNIFFSKKGFSRHMSRPETVHLLLKIILESFKLHYFFLTSNTYEMNISLCEHKSGKTDASLASHAGVFRGVLISSLPSGEGRNTSSPKNACVGGLCFIRGFRFCPILYSEWCAYILSGAFSKFRCLAA